MPFLMIECINLIIIHHFFKKLRLNYTLHQFANMSLNKFPHFYTLISLGRAYGEHFSVLIMAEIKMVSERLEMVLSCLAGHISYNLINRYHMHAGTFALDQKLRWKLEIITGQSFDQKFNFPNFPNYSKIVNLLKLIPDEVFEAYKHRLPGHILDKLLKNKRFENWGETVSTAQDAIIYPTGDVPADSGRQVQVIQDFVKEKASGIFSKRVRGSGIRHSWGNIFSDPNQCMVSFYPFEIATGSSAQLEKWAREMEDINEKLPPTVEHLCSIHKVGEIHVQENGKDVKKSLVKLGAGVSNEQMRLWCVKNNLQYKSNVIMVEVNVCGGLGTCSHGAGIDTQTLSDYIYEVEFIDHNGERRKISKKDHPELIASAASNLGLLGLMVFITLEMEDLDIIEFLPRNTYKDFTIPYPKDYAHAQQRKNRQQYQQWLQEGGKEPDWQSNFNDFKKAIHKTYCEWFYFPIEGTNVFENCWEIFGKKTPENVELANQGQGRFIEDYPPPIVKCLSEFALFLGDKFINNALTQATVNIFMRNPFTFFPHEKVFVNYPDGVHFQRGIQNMKVRDFEVEINVPAVEVDGVKGPDYDLIQRLWWSALELVEDKKELVNIALEMRVFKGSNATLAPEVGMDYVCSIEILRSLAFGTEENDAWRDICLQVFRIWRDTHDSAGNSVVIRPHWGKEWDSLPDVKQHVLNDVVFKGQFNKFLADYQLIADVNGFKKDINLKTFSNELYRELLNNAIGAHGGHIK